MSINYQTILAAMPKTLAKSLAARLEQPFYGQFTAAERETLEQQSGLVDHDLLLALLPLAAEFAYTPVSGFNVGAIAVGESGSLYFGANMELPQQTLFHSVHGEQSAISHAWLAGEKSISDIVVNASPCGHCRQFMNELTTPKELQITLPNEGSKSLSHYLPYAFGPKNLGISYGLMSAPALPLTIESADELVQLALGHAQASYAPYSKSPAAVVLETEDGQHFCGRYAENAAFNPSLPPMQMALNAMMLKQVPFTSIQRALLIEAEAAEISQVRASKSALTSISNVELEVVFGHQE
ncbi:cytidine deaminase [Ferrimonas lipolytica]|uniref:Cytidine deaminase n=1 Tax=Ferrimonas lipolytica TaxID=2724191 RepID=A0A6H1UAG8_9GAMM|nr:cytidine deaminase [Ferrimonas lipolytica]QIZ76055.1 cytidine deaminase [Ferrimonas lipolytica]